MNPLLRQSVLVLWVVTRRGCPLPKVQIASGFAAASTQIAALPFRTRPDAAVAPCQVCVCLCFNQLRSLLCRSGLDLTPLSRPVRSRARSHVLVEHLCSPVELRRPTRPPRFLPSRDNVELYPVGLGPAEAPRVSRCLSFTEKRPGWNLKDARRAKGWNRD